LVVKADTADVVGIKLRTTFIIDLTLHIQVLNRPQILETGYLLSLVKLHLEYMVFDFRSIEFDVVTSTF